uniref:Uncharacterized protein n=1 Tax=Timema monikensis TaxID=170555 RepID=A0A7R9E7A8_9NEOP|nr:unnamed protein product [Timema monikensis]
MVLDTRRVKIAQLQADSKALGSIPHVQMGRERLNEKAPINTTRRRRGVQLKLRGAAVARRCTQRAQSRSDSTGVNTREGVNPCPRRACRECPAVCGQNLTSVEGQETLPTRGYYNQERNWVSGIWRDHLTGDGRALTRVELPATTEQ